jgi:protein SCO1/2
VEGVVGETQGAGLGAAARRFVAGGGFPCFALSLLVFYQLFLLAILFAPGGAGGMGAFADEFRIWCFGYDPATGHFEPGLLVSMLTPPLLLGPVLIGVWWTPLRVALARPARLAAPVAAAAAIVAASAAGFALLGTQREGGELPFPAEELRTALPAPVLRLVNQANQPVDLAALRGKVVLLTAVYASCPHTCPAILAQAKRAIEAVPPEARADLRVVAVTLDPSHDSSSVLAELADMHELEAPLYQLVTGPPDEVEGVLDHMGVARTRDPQTGVIDHANLFLLLDRSGTLAYRLTLGERQERWLVSALQLLLREPALGG